MSRTIFHFLFDICHLSSSTKQIASAVMVMVIGLTSLACGVSAKNEVYFGKTTPPARNIFRYVTGDEPQSLDPQIPTGQPEGRILMALFDGLAEYDPKTTQPIPAIAESWEANNDSSEFVFHLRKNARWSNGDPITANDFVYTFRRGVSPELASQNAYLAYYVKYAQAYNSHRVFVQDPGSGQFLLAKDFNSAVASAPLSQTTLKTADEEYKLGAPTKDTAFHQLMHSPERLTLPKSETSRNKTLAKNPALQAAVAGKKFIDVKPEDIGVEAVDEYTLRITMSQSAPYFLTLIPHQFFRLAPQKVIQQYGDQWTDPAHIVTCGAFRLKSWKPYNELVVERDPLNWDAANVHLDEIYFYPMNDNPAIMNLYKVGEIDAVLNHVVPYFWLDIVRSKKDYMDAPEAAITYIIMNVTKPPMNDVRIRKAFNLAIDKVTYSKVKQITKPLTAFTPEGIFPGYPQPKGDAFDPENARHLLGEAGFPVTKKADGGYECKRFPIDQVEYTFNTQSANKTMAEYVQAQWKQNLGITVQLKSMEFKTYLPLRNNLEYKGFAIGIWGADYLDPYTFLGLMTGAGTNGTGWSDPKYDAMLDEANLTLDHQKRYDLLAKAEEYLLAGQPIIPIETTAVNFVKKPYVKGMYPNAMSMYPWKFVYIERDQSKWESGQ
jgi:oligopeptide transport system substrate-binding protein